MQVHLVAVEVGVVGRRHRQVHPERRPVQHLDAVAHDGHLVQRRLPVEDDDVVVPQVSLHRVAVLQGQAVLVPDESEVHAHSVVANDVSLREKERGRERERQRKRGRQRERGGGAAHVHEQRTPESRQASTASGPLIDL